MGYYTQKYSTVFKGPLSLALKSRWDSKKQVRNTRKAYNAIVRKLPEQVVEEHKVTKALRLHDSVVDELKAAAHESHQIALNQSIQEQNILKTVVHIEEVVGKITELHKQHTHQDKGFEKIVEEFIVIMVNAMREAINEGHDVYKKVLAVLKQLENSKQLDHDTLMTRVRTYFKKGDPSRLAGMAMRRELSKERRYMNQLKGISKRFENLSKKMDNKLSKSDALNALEEFRKLVVLTKPILHDVFYEAYMVLKRDLLILLNVLMLADYLELEDYMWVSSNLLPKAPTLEKIEHIKEFKEDLAKEIHAIAQAMNIIVSQEKRIESEAQKIRA